MPEPNALDFPRYLGRDIDPDAEMQAGELRRELADLRELAEMFTHPGWAVFYRHVEGLADQTRRELETCPIDKVEAVRARLAWWREVLDYPTWTASDIVNTQTRLEEFEPAPEEDE